MTSGRSPVLPAWAVPALTVVALAAADVASAQTATSRTVLVTVADPKGRAVTDLREDDFVVEQSDEAREILSVRLADYPIILLLDNINDRVADFEAIRRAATRFVARIGRERAVAIGALANPDTMLTSFDDERAKVAAVLEQVRRGRPGQDFFLEGIGNAARVLRGTETPFSAIIVISAASLELPVPRGRSDELLGPAMSGRTMVHVVARTAALPSGVVGTLGDALRGLTEQTRGQFTPIFSVVSYQAALDRVAERLLSELMIEFIEPPGAAADGDVKVGVRIPGARVTGLGVSR